MKKPSPWEPKPSRNRITAEGLAQLLIGLSITALCVLLLLEMM